MPRAELRLTPQKSFSKVELRACKIGMGHVTAYEIDPRPRPRCAVLETSPNRFCSFFSRLLRVGPLSTIKKIPALKCRSPGFFIFYLLIYICLFIQYCFVDKEKRLHLFCPSRLVSVAFWLNFISEKLNHAKKQQIRVYIPATLCTTFVLMLMPLH